MFVLVIVIEYFFDAVHSHVMLVGYFNILYEHLKGIGPLAVFNKPTVLTLNSILINLKPI